MNCWALFLCCPFTAWDCSGHNCFGPQAEEATGTWIYLDLFAYEFGIDYVGPKTKLGSELD